MKSSKLNGERMEAYASPKNAYRKVIIKDNIETERAYH